MPIFAKEMYCSKKCTYVYMYYVANPIHILCMVFMKKYFLH